MPFEFIDGITPAQEIWQPFREYAWDLEKHDFVVKNGKIAVLEGIPALKIWIYKTLLTQRGRYRAYTWDYGNDLDSLIASTSMVRDVLVSEAKRITEEALLMNERIQSLKNFEAWLSDSMLHIRFIAVTDSGEIEVDSNV